MHTDARNMENNSVIEGDLCIVGAGASGISMAMEWANTNHKVILLEGGGFEYDEKVQELYAGKGTGQPYFPLKAIRLHYFGGTTGHWAGFCSTFDEIDFKKRDWVPHSGWPINKKDVDPYYKRANPILDLGPDEWSASYWLKQNPEFKSLPFNEKILWNKMWQFSSAYKIWPEIQRAHCQFKKYSPIYLCECDGDKNKRSCFFCDRSDRKELCRKGASGQGQIFCDSLLLGSKCPILACVKPPGAQGTRQRQ